MGKLAWWLEKSVYVTVAFAAVMLFLLLFDRWQTEKGNYFFFVGDYSTWLVVFIAGTAIAWLFKWLWKLEIRSIFKPRPKKGAK